MYSNDHFESSKQFFNMCTAFILTFQMNKKKFTVNCPWSIGDENRIGTKIILLQKPQKCIYLLYFLLYLVGVGLNFPCF